MFFLNFVVVFFDYTFGRRFGLDDSCKETLYRIDRNDRMNEKFLHAKAYQRVYRGHTGVVQQNHPSSLSACSSLEGKPRIGVQLLVKPRGIIVVCCRGGWRENGNRGFYHVDWFLFVSFPHFPLSPFSFFLYFSHFIFRLCPFLFPAWRSISTQSQRNLLLLYFFILLLYARINWIFHRNFIPNPLSFCYALKFRFFFFFFFFFFYYRSPSQLACSN